jgi:hypothetical protein
MSGMVRDSEAELGQGRRKERAEQVAERSKWRSKWRSSCKGEGKKERSEWYEPVHIGGHGSFTPSDELRLRANGSEFECGIQITRGE